MNPVRLLKATANANRPYPLHTIHETPYAEELATRRDAPHDVHAHSDVDVRDVHHADSFAPNGDIVRCSVSPDASPGPPPARENHRLGR